MPDLFVNHSNKCCAIDYDNTAIYGYSCLTYCITKAPFTDPQGTTLTAGRDRGQPTFNVPSTQCPLLTPLVALCFRCPTGCSIFGTGTHTTTRS